MLRDWEHVLEMVSDLRGDLSEIGGCTDGYCIIEKQRGQHTNGGCRCSTNARKMQLYAYFMERFVKRVESYASIKE